MNTPQKVWIESITSHLELLNQIASRLPANERLEAKDLNNALDLLHKFHQTFLFQLELQGFKLGDK